MRNDVLRVPLGLTFKDYDHSVEKDQYHLAIIIDNVVQGILILNTISREEVKMRQVAIRPQLRGMGYGKVLVAAAEDFAKNEGHKLISLHSRDVAVPFYLKLGYQKIGEEFTEVGIPHWKLFKNL